MAALAILEIHKNRIETAGAPDEYFEATPALERLSIWGNQLTELPSSLSSCPKLVGLQVPPASFGESGVRLPLLTLLDLRTGAVQPADVAARWALANDPGGGRHGH